MIIALPLLPANSIEEGYLAITNVFNDFVGEQEDLKHEIQALLRYVKGGSHYGSGKTVDRTENCRKAIFTIGPAFSILSCTEERCWRISNAWEQRSKLTNKLKCYCLFYSVTFVKYFSFITSIIL